MRDDRERLRDILEASTRIEKYTANGRDAFDNEELIQSWVLRHVQIIGEAARTLSPEFRAQDAEIQWPEMIGTRHILVHRYFGIDDDLVWEIVETNLPELKRAVATIIQSADEAEATNG
jgi:uncharacterized protein with HEPN domain